ncbi:hypothetical protein Nepgr_029101 [Nepenthes gracilis]|uniref:Uncharacterized protein n=1 Tax=Nepenthes gracilis TaxID=150966 RepID=A0AAD3TBW8_NEPGR|nr:hypothetical protein Nepgr_029101 [Nepenthes gracilis]
MMVLAYNLPNSLLIFNSEPGRALARTNFSNQVKRKSSIPIAQIQTQLKRCLRCNTLYHDNDNSPVSCSFHGHINGEKGLFALAPPHQGIDGDWTDQSGVIVYKWNEPINRPNTGSSNWKRRWSCCSDFGWLTVSVDEK